MCCLLTACWAFHYLRADSAQVVVFHDCRGEVEFDVGIQEKGQI